MPTNVNTLSIEITANAGGVEKAAKKAGQAIAGLKDAEINVNADTAEAQQKLKDAQAQADSLDGGEIPVDADTTEAQQKLKDAQEQAEGLADGKYSVHVDADTGDAESAIEGLKSKITGVLAGIGAGAAVKQILEFGVESIGLASDYEQTLGKARQMLDETSFSSVQAYTEGKYEKYGLNRTGILDMTTNFAGAYKSMGIESEQAAQYAERMADAAIDYASVLNKTPAEVGEIMMSLMRGNTAVADNISLYGLTADKMMARAKELKEKGLIPEGMDEASAKYVALLNIIEENSDTLGFTGDWDRTYEQYANQTTLLAEQWQTLKTNVGTLLEPAATDIVKFLNQILTGMNEFTEGAKAHSFTDDVNGYFGTMEITEADLQPIVDKITGPMDEATEAINTAEGKLATANQAYKTAYGELQKTLTLITAGGEVNEDEVAAGVNAVRDAQTDLLEAERDTLLSQFVAYMGSDEEWGEATSNAVSQINSYYDAQITAAEEKANQLAKVIHSSIHDDGTIDAAEMEQIRASAKELNNTTLNRATGRSRAVLEATDVARGGKLSAQSIMTAYNAVMGSVGESFQDYDQAFMDFKAQIYAFQEQQIRNGEENVIDADAVIAESRAAYNETRKTAEAQAIAALADLIVPSLLEGFSGLTEGELNNSQLKKQYGEQINAVLGMVEFAGIIGNAMESGADLGANAQNFFAFYNMLSGLYPGGEMPVNPASIWTSGYSVSDQVKLAQTDEYDAIATSIFPILDKDTVQGEEAGAAETAAAEMADAMVSAVDSGNDAIVSAVDNATRTISSVADRPYIIRIYQSPYSAGSYRMKENSAYSKVLGR